MSIFTSEVEAQLPDGFLSLVDGYGKYAADIAINRAIPAVDGFKPSARCILYTMHKNKFTSLTKSATVCGRVLEYHPHSDASVYETATTMVDSTEYLQMPFIHGKGNFSKVFFSAKDSQAAAQRYTEMCLNDNAKLIFGEMDGIEMQPTEDGHTEMPTLLPSSFPVVLTQAAQGIAVGLACNIPSFNFNEVLSLTIDYLKTGKVSRVIAPDFATGGDYVLNNKALEGIMLEGKGQIKLRGKWVVQDKDIVITQIPYYTRISDILTKASELRGVASANDETDLYGMKIRITCTSKAVVNQVVLELLRDTGLQYTMTANIGIVVDNQVKYMGVIDVIKKWCDFRRGVLNKQYTLDLEKVRSAMRAPKALIELIENQPLKEKFLDALKTNDVEAEKILKAAMPDLDNDVVDYIMGLTIRQFGNCEARKRQYKSLQDKESQLLADLGDIDRCIIRQLTLLNKEHVIPRKTSIVTNDYSFESLEEVEEAAQAVSNYTVFVQINGLYIKKLRFYSGKGDEVIRCNNNDVISVLDNRGRLLRIALSNVPDTEGDSVGSYIPVLLDIKPDFKPIDYHLVENKKIRYFYNDGFASVLDLGEWTNLKRVTRVTERGVAPDHVDKIRCILPDLEEYTHLLCVTKNKAMGIFSLNFAEKARTARTKLGTIPKNDELWFIAPMTTSEAWSLLTGNTEKYRTQCHVLDKTVALNNAVFNKIAERRI